MKEKKNWNFYSKRIKIGTLGLQMICVAGFVLFVFLAAYVVNTVSSLDDLFERRAYQETSGFGYEASMEVHQAAQYGRYKTMFETDGVLDSSRYLDIMNPRAKKNIKDNTSFKIADLEKMVENGVAFMLEDIVETMEMQESYSYYGSDQEATQVYGSEQYGQLRSIEARTKGGQNITEVLAGSGSEYTYRYLKSLMQVLAKLDAYLENRNFLMDQDTNLKFYARNSKTGTVLTNVSSWEGLKSLPDHFDKGWSTLLAGTRVSGRMKYEKMPQDSAQEYLQNFFRGSVVLGDDEEILLAVDTKFAAADYLRDAKEVYERYQPYFVLYAVLAILFFIGAVICFVAATVQTGRTEKGKAVVLNRFDKIPTELAAAAVGVVLVVILSLVSSMGMFSGAEEPVLEGAVITVLAVAVAAVFMWGYLSMVRRIKGKILWSNSLLHSIVKMCKSVYEARQTSGKVIILFIGFILLHLLFLAALGGFGILLVLIGDVLVLLFLVKECAGRQTIQEGLKRIAGGDLDYKIDLSTLKGENKEMAVCVNSVGDGLQEAVKRTIKNERLKAELITNVSHDIKTPLTSIINYVDLLKRENLKDPKVQGYIEVLDAKAWRLKQLTEDLVEASKASTGNIELHMIKIQVQQMLQQAYGEFDERFQERELRAVLNQTEEPAVILADGKQLWRIFENLLQNIYKYAMPGTRVYIDLKKESEKVVLTFKNMSEYPLNITAEELTERFTRGDASRSTEGSGLGLSIAKDLTRMQGGTFDIYLDGDLFKVTVVFQCVEP